MDWGVFLQQAPSGGMTYLGWLASGTMWTLLVSLAAWIIAFTLGSILGVLRTTPLRVPRAIATAYVELFRNIPLLVQMFLWYFVMPEVIPKAWGDWIKTQLPNLVELPFAQFSMWEFLAAVMCLGLYTASRVAEQVRAGIQSLPRGQAMAGTALGLTLPQTYRHVILPMAFRIVLPPLTSESMNIIKNSSVALTIGLLELTGRARAMQEFSFQVFEAFAAATVLYLLTNLVVVLGMRALEHRVRLPGFIGPTPGAGAH